MTWHIVLSFALGLMAGVFLMAMMAMSARHDEWKDSL